VAVRVSSTALLTSRGVLHAPPPANPNRPKEFMQLSNLKISSYVTISEGCPMRFRVNSSDDVEFSFGDIRSPFEFVFDNEALRAYLALGAEALAEMEAMRNTEQEPQA
jgi:hypothetical protein